MALCQCSWNVEGPSLHTVHNGGLLQAVHKRPISSCNELISEARTQTLRNLTQKNVKDWGAGIGAPDPLGNLACRNTNLFQLLHGIFGRANNVDFGNGNGVNPDLHNCPDCLAREHLTKTASYPKYKWSVDQKDLPRTLGEVVGGNIHNLLKMRTT